MGAMSSQGPPQLGALSFQSPPPPAAHFVPGVGPHAHQRDSGGMNPLLQNPTASQGNLPPSMLAAAPIPRQQSPPTQVAAKPVFGIPLSKLYERDGLAVPMVVYQCIQAIDLYGLNMEGIYRQSGSLNSINKLKVMFDTGKCSSRPQ